MTVAPLSLDEQLLAIGLTELAARDDDLAQLLEDPGARPVDRVFMPQTLPEIFGDLYQKLSKLPIGDMLDIGDIAELRSAIPLKEPASRDSDSCFRFRHVRVRRGAWFHGMPASSTARLFTHMTEEPPPWFFTLVPELLSRSST